MDNEQKGQGKYSFSARKSRLANTISTVDKIQPQATDLEEAVLGALMLEKDALSAVIDVLKPELFYDERHKRVFEAIQTLFQKSKPVDILTVTTELRTNGSLEMIGGAYYVTYLTNRVSSAANIEFHARIISQKYIQRELIRISTEIIKNAYEDTTDIFDLLDMAEKNLFDIAQNNLRRDTQKMDAIIKQSLASLEELRTKTDGLTGVPSGFTDLDRVTGGWQKSDLVIIAARPAMGKTAFVLSCARNAAVDFQKPVVVFSLATDFKAREILPISCSRLPPPSPLPCINCK